MRGMQIGSTQNFSLLILERSVFLLRPPPAWAGRIRVFPGYEERFVCLLCARLIAAHGVRTRQSQLALVHRTERRPYVAGWSLGTRIAA